MSAPPAFDVQLARLIEARGVDAGSLARRAEVAETAVTSVLGGGEPEPLLLRRLAPALGLHRSDLFIIADRPVPDDLTLQDPAEAAALIWDARRLTADQLRQVYDRAHAIRHERADELERALRCGCPGPA